MVADLDLKFERAIADDVPSALLSPAIELEQSSAVDEEIAELRGGHAASEGGLQEAAAGARLPVLGRAPEFAGTQRWFNTPGGRPLSLRACEGRWCWSTSGPTPASTASARFPTSRPGSASTSGTGSPSWASTRPSSRSRRRPRTWSGRSATKGSTYPVAQDNDYATWTAYGNQYWPAKYLIDARGRVRFVHFGEGSYAETERAIRSLLAEAGQARLGGRAKASAETADPAVTTPESYLGASRAERFANGPIRPAARCSKRSPRPGCRPVIWPTPAAGGSAATPRPPGAMRASRSASRRGACSWSWARATVPQPVRVTLDGRPIPDSLAGEDVSDAEAVVSAQRLYRLVDLPRAGRHVLTLRFAPGVAGYAFTFG